MAATIRTASKTTASLSDAKSLKTGPRCQEGRAEEIVAMIGRPVSARIGRGSTRLLVIPSESRGSRRESFELTSSGSLDSARDNGKETAVIDRRYRRKSLRPSLPAFSDRFGIM